MQRSPLFAPCQYYLTGRDETYVDNFARGKHYLGSALPFMLSTWLTLWLSALPSRLTTLLPAPFSDDTRPDVRRNNSSIFCPCCNIARMNWTLELLSSRSCSPCSRN